MGAGDFNDNGVCPCCGYCKHCGRGPGVYPSQPLWWYRPYYIGGLAGGGAGAGGGGTFYGSCSAGGAGGGIGDNTTGGSNWNFHNNVTLTQ